MKKFLKRFFYFLAALYVFLWGLQLIADFGLRNNYSPVYYEWSSVTNGKINSDIVIFGSSRALKHFDPAVFERKLNRSAYNLGADGAPYGFQLLKVKNYLANNKEPEFIIQNVDILSMSQERKLLQKEKYFPYYYSLEALKIMSKYDDNIVWEAILPVYKYRGYRDEFFMGLGSHFFNFERKMRGYKGYIGSTDTWDNSFEAFKNEYPDVFDQDFEPGYEDFLSIISEINKTKTTLFLVWSPEYYKLQEFEGDLLPKMKLKYSNLAASNDNIYFLDYTKDSLNYSTDYFYNFNHLNKKGATILSTRVADTINWIMQQKTKE
ncbi:hypothetical protein [Constantimarinum furrinae]|uniref:SGNH/GDSL hydrolase family protein n=1 Tax=Constantimarinum furrinae TaxID=2562285 RepID=A0A7G8PQT1_9FLAO|nr:hypothetical protein [Constantimarinum furrinae]QNJ96697.1 hypothetical protein ALE3EI_0106 [Constantimarinum furrinae]